MAQTETAVRPVFRGRRPSLETLDARIDDLVTGIESVEGRSRIASKRLETLVEQGAMIRYHLEAYKAKGEKIGHRLGRLAGLEDRLAAVLEQQNGETEAPGVSVPVVSNGHVDTDAYLQQIRATREKRDVLQRELEALETAEFTQLAELGRSYADSLLAG